MKGRKLRLTNFLIDTGMYLVFMIIFLMIFRRIVSIESVKWISILYYFLYYFLFEYFKGQTIGKMITKSKVVSLSKNNNYYFLRIFGRTFMRFIPIDIFSYLFSSSGLHDRISKTSTVLLTNSF